MPGSGTAAKVAPAGKVGAPAAAKSNAPPLPTVTLEPASRALGVEKLDRPLDDRRAAAVAICAAENQYAVAQLEQRRSR